MYSIGELARLTGLTRRTLRYYEHLGLLRPERDPNNGYRRYTDAETLRLQQIMLYREMDLPARTIQSLMDDPDYSTLATLKRHRDHLANERQRLDRLLATVDTTLEQLERGDTMTESRLFRGFDPAKQATWAEEAAEHWDEDLVRDSQKRWQAYSETEREAILAEGDAVYQALADAMDQAADTPGVQALMHRWHRHLEYFYQPSVAMLRGLGAQYIGDSRFTDNIDRFRPGLAAYMNEAIQVYCDRLEGEA